MMGREPKLATWYDRLRASADSLETLQLTQQQRRVMDKIREGHMHTALFGCKVKLIVGPPFGTRLKWRCESGDDCPQKQDWQSEQVRNYV